MKKQTPYDFSKQLIKGKIAEMIFEQMLRDTEKFTVLAFGYENVLPELMHKQRDIHVEETMEIIRRAPDFAVINNETHDVHLIEVKYRRRYTADNILEIAKRMHASWKPAYLFLATPNRFYLGQAHAIVKNEGKIEPLRSDIISEQTQEKYISLLNNFISANS
jgi:hypothetical protein